jgi:alkylhydroperoxidase family enzyme
MSWLRVATDKPSPFEGVLGLRPELLKLYRSFYGQLWDGEMVPPNLLELCRLRIALIHGCEAETAIRHVHAGVSDEQVAALDHWRAAACFSLAERAALALADKIPRQHHEVTDADVAALREHLDDPQVVALTLAATLFDAHCRLRLVLGVTPRPARVDVPAAADGVLY